MTVGPKTGSAGFPAAIAGSAYSTVGGFNAARVPYTACASCGKDAVVPST